MPHSRIFFLNIKKILENKIMRDYIHNIVNICLFVGELKMKFQKLCLTLLLSSSFFASEAYGMEKDDKNPSHINKNNFFTEALTQEEEKEAKSSAAGFGTLPKPVLKLIIGHFSLKEGLAFNALCKYTYKILRTAKGFELSDTLKEKGRETLETAIKYMGSPSSEKQVGAISQELGYKGTAFDTFTFLIRALGIDKKINGQAYFYLGEMYLSGEPYMDYALKDKKRDALPADSAKALEYAKNSLGAGCSAGFSTLMKIMKRQHDQVKLQDEAYKAIVEAADQAHQDYKVVMQKENESEDYEGTSESERATEIKNFTWEAMSALGKISREKSFSQERKTDSLNKLQTFKNDNNMWALLVLNEEENEEEEEEGI
jgi:hypothetical protein